MNRKQNLLCSTPTRFLCLFVTLVFVSLAANGQAPKISWDLDDALKQINRQSDNFDSALSRALIVRENAAGEEISRDTATLFINDDGKIRIEIDEPNRLTYLMTRGDLYIYNPEKEVVEQYSLSRHKSRLEPYARLGFSDTGKDLEDDFLVTSLGEQDIGESRALGLDLTPKKEKIRQVVSGVKLWIDQASWMPTRQVIADTQSGETLVITYTHTARNLNLNPDLFKAKWPRGTDKKRM